MANKKSVKNIFQRAAVCACGVIFALLCASGPAIAGSDGSPDGYDSWDDYFNSLLQGGETETVDVPPLSEMKKVAENDNFTMYFDENGVDFHIVDRRTKKLWSTAIHPDYMDISGKTPETCSSLLKVVLANTEDGISPYTLTSSGTPGFDISSREEEDGITLRIAIPDAEVSFDFRASLDDDGFTVTVPEESIVCSGSMQMLNIDFLPQFGAAKIGESGYIFYPDGEGALIDFQDYAYPLLRSYSYPLYGMSDADVDTYETRVDQSINNLMLPVYGIKHKDGGFLAVAQQGDADATLMMEIQDSYNVWFHFDYSRYVTADFNYTGVAKGGGQVSQLLDKHAKGDRTVKYFLLPGEKATYSDMAVVYREWLEEQGILKPLSKTDAIPMSLELFMSVSKNGILGKQMENLTTYKQAAEIASDLSSASVGSLQLLLTGWAADGYEAMPTPAKYSSALGGADGFRKLSEVCKENGVDLFANCEYVIGDSEHGSYNAKKDILRDLVGLVISKETSSLVFMNPVRSLMNNLSKAIKKSNGQWQISLSNVGNLALPSVYAKDVSYRSETVNAYAEALKLLQTKQETVSVSGGNGYVLPYATRLYDIPDTDSQYMQNSRSVPFYQMVVHGSVEYTSLAGNLSVNEQIQKLHWVETGSVPHYLLTYESPVALRGTSYNQLFSSEYKQWKEVVLKTYSEFNERLSSVWYQQMTNHEQLSDDVVCVTYENGAKTYINYGSEEAEVNGVKIPATDYVVVQGK